MSQKRPRPVPPANTARRVLTGMLVGVLLVAATVVLVRWLRDDAPTTVATAPPAATSASPELEGTYDVMLMITSVEYGATWPATSPRLAAGERVPQAWVIECSGPSC